MNQTEHAGWTLVQVRAQHHWDDPGPNKLRWRTSPSVYSEYREAVSWATESGGFGPPSRRRVPHPTVQDAMMVIEPPHLWIVLPIPAGVEHYPYCERVYRAAPTDWMERILLPTPGDPTVLAKPQEIVSDGGEGPTCTMCGHWYDPEFTTGLYCRLNSPDDTPNPGCPPQQEDRRRFGIGQ